jgi:hypothetical protein
MRMNSAVPRGSTTRPLIFLNKLDSDGSDTAECEA